MLKSEANLAASLRADWSETARGAAKTLLARLAAYRSAGATRQVQFIAEASNRQRAQQQPNQGDYDDIARRFGAQRLADENAMSLAAEGDRFFVPEENLQAMIDHWMARFGYDQAVVTQADFIFQRRNDLYERLAGALL
jgi:ATP phosphoribosyltransferase